MVRIGDGITAGPIQTECVCVCYFKMTINSENVRRGDCILSALECCLLKNIYFFALHYVVIKTHSHVLSYSPFLMSKTHIIRKKNTKV